MNGSEFIDTAKISIESNDEASMRNVSSRSYYGLYHISRNILVGLPYVRCNHHAHLIRYLNSATEGDIETLPASTRKILGRILKQERSRRNEADYRIDDLVYTRQQAMISLKSAERVIELLDSFTKNNIAS